MTNPDKQKPVEVTDVEAGEKTAAPPVPPPSAITQEWKREDLIKKASPILRGLGFLFSLLSFIITVSNKHGDGLNYDNYEEYKYLLAIAIISTLYTLGQIFLHFSKNEVFDQRTSTLIGFAGDQIVAYLLISSASSAIPITNRFREVIHNVFIDSAAAAISMTVFAFVSLAISSLFSGYKLSTQSFI